MSQLLALPLYRLTDSNGVIIPNGRLYSFLTGTTTPAATYTTDELNVSHGNYVQADSAGLLPPIYLDPAVTYRLQVRATPYAAAVSGMDFDPVSVSTASMIQTTGGDTVQEALDAGAFPIKNAAAVDVATVDRLETYSGTGTATAGAPRFYLGAKTPIGDDSAMCVGRIVTGNLLFSHAFRDESEVTISGGGAYTSNDAFITVKTSTTKYNHSYGFQWRSIFQATNDIDLFAGFVSYPVVSGAGVTVDRLYHFHVQGLTLSGGAVVSQHVGVYVSPLSGGTGTDYGLFIEANDAYIGGNLQIGGILNGVTSLVASGQVTGKDFMATGGITAFADGVAVVGTFGASNYGAIQAYDDTGGATKGFCAQPSGGQFLIGGGGVPVTGATLEVNGSISLTSSPPANAAATGVAGTIAWDSGFFYICVSANSWKRVAIATW